MSRVQSIERAFAVLASLADGPLGVTEVATRSRLPKSTAARLLAALIAEGAVEQANGGGRYRLGPRILALGAGLRQTRGLIATAHPFLAELAEATGEAAGLSVPDGRDMHYIDQVESPNPVRVRDWTGTRIPMHTVSSGLVVLANLSGAALDELLGEPLERFTPHTETDPARLRRRLVDIRRDGVAWAREEYAEGIISVAAPIADADGEVVAAVHVHGPSYRFPPPGHETEIAAAVIEAAARIGSRLRG
ncbi:MAG: IclR family transcriptional regulator [Chloroflexi bacterium]|nr:IclR family transcriptional regulator [Chloroflexota bacterium]